MNLTPRWTSEDQLPPSQRPLLRALLAACFPDFFETRTYHKQRPHHRLLAWDEDALVGHVALEHRAIRLSDQPATIGGVVDLCVAPSHRGRGLGATLLTALEDRCRAAPCDFVVLFADDPRLYARAGYTRATNHCTYWAIDEHRSLGLREHPLDDCMWIKPLHQRPWTDGPVDLLGTVF